MWALIDQPVSVERGRTPLPLPSPSERGEEKGGWGGEARVRARERREGGDQKRRGWGWGWGPNGVDQPRALTPDGSEEAAGWALALAPAGPRL